MFARNRRVKLSGFIKFGAKITAVLALIGALEQFR
jgi:hypothetical protein